MSARLSTKAKSMLDSLYRQYDQRRDIVDPIQRVHDFSKRQDQEVVGVCAAALGLGITTSLQPMGLRFH